MAEARGSWREVFLEITCSHRSNSLDSDFKLNKNSSELPFLALTVNLTKLSKKGCQLRDLLDQIGLWACLWGLSWLIIGVGGPSPLWVAPIPGRIVRDWTRKLGKRAPTSQPQNEARTRVGVWDGETGRSSSSQSGAWGQNEIYLYEENLPYHKGTIFIHTEGIYSHTEVKQKGSLLFVHLRH